MNDPDESRVLTGRDEEETKLVQLCLKFLVDNDLKDNGHYGKYTQAAVMRFQRELTPGSKTDGIVTSEVWDNIKSKN